MGVYRPQLALCIFTLIPYFRFSGVRLCRLLMNSCSPEMSNYDPDLKHGSDHLQVPELFLAPRDAKPGSIGHPDPSVPDAERLLDDRIRPVHVFDPVRCR